MILIEFICSLHKMIHPLPNQIEIPIEHHYHIIEIHHKINDQTDKWHIDSREGGQ